MTAYWSTAQFGCLDRSSVAIKSISRTLLTTIEGAPARSITTDVRAPLEVQFSVTQSLAQFAAFTSWVTSDLACGALPFAIDLWLWDQWRRVRARLHSAVSSRRDAPGLWVTSGVFEIERESITPGFAISPWPVINITARTVQHVVSPPSSANASYRLNADGTVRNHTNAVLENWVTPAALTSQYQVMATLLSGTTPAGTLNTWMDLTANRSWGLGRSTSGTTSCALSVSIRHKMTGAILDTANIGIQAVVQS